MAYKFNNQRVSLALQKATDTKHVFIDSGLISNVCEIFTQCFGDKKAVIVADENTFSVAGKQVYDQFLANRRIDAEPFVFPGKPMLYADFQNVLLLKNYLQEHAGIPVVVGSGTLNDLTKLASFRCNRPYMIVATAASMDGYTSYGAAITIDGFKQTSPCSAPYALLADLDVIANAPYQLTASGYGDLFGKITAGADWLIADALGIDMIDDHAWSLVQESLNSVIDKSEKLQSGDISSVGSLIEGLVLCGLSMQAIHSSRPASGSEHQFSHLWEMHETAHGVISHGFKVSLGSVASAGLYEQVLNRNLQQLDIHRICSTWPTISQLEMSVRNSFSDPVIAQKAVDQSLAKYVDPQRLPARLHEIQNTWPELQRKLRNQLLPAGEARRLLHKAGCPVHPNDIGKNLSDLKSSYSLARQIRNRYTVFDLAAETGCFDDCVEELFAEDGFWTKASIP